MIKEIKWFIQRGRRGWADCDWWDMHSYIADMMPALIRKLKGGSGCPSEFYKKEAVNDECHKWSETLEEIAQGFEAAKFLGTCGYQKWAEGDKPGYKKLETDYEAMENARKKMERGLELFAKHYLNLWD